MHRGPDARVRHPRDVSYVLMRQFRDYLDFFAVIDGKGQIATGLADHINDTVI